MSSSDWISLEALLLITGWSKRTIYNKQQSGELKTRLVAAAANGKRRRDYDASTLPPDLQQKRMQYALAPISQKPSRPPAVQTLASLDKAEKEQATQRLNIIRPLIEFQNSGQEPLSAPGVRVSSLSAIIKHLSTATGYSERTLWNWWHSYREGGPGALADRPRKDNGTSRFFAEHKEAAQFAQNKFLNERLSITMVHEALLREWPRLRTASENAPPCFDTVRLFLNSLPPIITAVAHGGERAYKEDFAPFLLRDRSKVHANQYWLSDHMLHDVWVRNLNEETGAPVFGELQLNEAFRPWLTAIEDMKSRLIVGWTWCANPSSNSISSALRCALEQYGRPQSAFYVDNGKDYNKISDDASGVLSRLGIRAQHCTPRHPQAKQIESFFHILHQRFDVMWRPFYAGTSPKSRPEECDRVLQEHKKLMADGQASRSPLPAASKFLQLAAQWLHEFNQCFKDKAPGLAGRTPIEIFDADLPPEQREVIKAADVAQLFWDRQRRVVREGGTVQIFNARYEPADAESAAALTLSIQREVLVACDPNNLGEAIALTLDGKRFLGTLRAQELLVHGQTSVEEIRASMRKRSAAYRAVKNYTRRLEQARVAAGDLAEIEVLEQRAVASGAKRPRVYALPLPRAVGSAAPQRKFVNDIVDDLMREGF